MNATTFLTFLLITVTIGVISWYKTRTDKPDTITGFFLANRNLRGVLYHGAPLWDEIASGVPDDWFWPVEVSR